MIIFYKNLVSRFNSDRLALNRPPERASGRPRMRAVAQRALELLFVIVILVVLLGSRAQPSVYAAPTNLIVTNLNDSGPGSLRDAINNATTGDTITFAVTGMITLTSSELLVDQDLTLVGPGASSLSISANPVLAQASRVIHNSAHLTISGLTIRGGRAGAGFGGGILNTGTGNLVLTNTIITANAAQKGGGVYNSPGGTVQVINSAFSANQTELFDAGLDASGAGLYNAGNVSIKNSTFNLNLVHDNGSALYNTASATVSNSTFSLNQEAGAGAIYNESGSMQLNNTTITVNTGKKFASGLYAAGGSVILSNSILADNHTVGNTSLPDCAGTISSSGYNLIGNASGCDITSTTGDQMGTDIAPINARLGPLTSNGGPTLTHSLLINSPAIDAGNPTLTGTGAGACEASDQRGTLRPQDGNADTTARCDIGAVELLLGKSYSTFMPVILTP